MSEALSVIERSELAKHEAVIERGLATFYEVGNALIAIRIGSLYRTTHATFEEYCDKRWNLKQSHAYRMIDSAKVMTNLQSSPIGELPKTESQVRELVSLEPQQQREVWQAAVETAPEGKITAAHIRSVVNNLTQGEQATIKAISREITARNAEEQNGAREMYRAEAVEAGLTPQQEAAADFGAGWYKNLHKHWVFYNSLRDHGGIAKLARKWSKEVKQHTLTELQTIRDCMNECIEYFEKELGK